MGILHISPRVSLSKGEDREANEGSCKERGISLYSTACKYVPISSKAG